MEIFVCLLFVEEGKFCMLTLSVSFQNIVFLAQWYSSHAFNCHAVVVGYLG